MNIIVNGDFENGLYDWATDGLVFVADDVGKVGPKCAALLYVYFPGSGPQDAMLSQSFPVRAGEIYLVSFWYRLASTPEGGTLTAKVKHAGEVDTLLETTDWRADWTRCSVLWQAEADGDAVLVFRATDEARIWYVDGVEVAQVSKTQEIKDAIVSDLEGISTGDGYSCTVAEVGKEPKRIDEARSPAVYILPGEGGVSDIETLSNTKGYATQRYTLQLVMKSATPNADMDNFLDDVRNAIEKSDSNVLAVPGVEMVAVTDWDEVVAPGDVNMDVYYREATVEVRYLYGRGSV